MGKEMNVKTIKKVVEAKARRKRRVAKKLDQARKKKEVSYVVAKKHKAQKRAQRPANVKGPYKQVDPRMKKDSTAKRSGAKQGQRRRLKGKQAKPTKQFNTNKHAPNRR